MRPHDRLTAAVVSILLLAGCGAQPPARTAASAPAPPEATVQVGDVTMRASVVQTSALAAGIASQYGIPRDDGTVLLLVALRQGADGAETALPARVTATVTDLRGQRQDIAMRELRTGDLLDYVGTVQTTLPDTLRFDIQIVREDGATSSLQLNREFYPR